MSEHRRAPWAEYWTSDPLALHANRPDSTRLIDGASHEPLGLAVDTMWHDSTDTWIAAPTRSARIGNPHIITTDAYPDPGTGTWTVRAWAFSIPAHDPSLTDLAKFAIRNEEPHLMARVHPQPPKKTVLETRAVQYPERFPIERTFQVLSTAVETAAIRAAYRLVTETHPSVTLNRMTYGRSLTGLLDGHRFAVRFKGQRAILTMIPTDRNVHPGDSVEVRLPGPHPFLHQLDGSPAERITEALRMLLQAKDA